MLARQVREVPPAADVAVMGAADIAGIQELVALTRPGPFAARTTELGRFLGIRVNGRLAAIAGERLRLDGFTEVSAVCTHPKHRRKGYAAMLVSAAARNILARGERPFLHVLPDNAAAIAAYEALGFERRRVMHLTVLTRNLEG
jgi:predicted GNAT family acetyltransferase